MRVFAMVWLFVATSVAAVELGKQADFNVPPQPLATAVVEFAKQAQVQLFADGQRLDGVTSKGVRGRLSIGDGLKVLLEGTGLGFKVVGANSISLTSLSSAGSDVHRAESIM